MSKEGILYVPGPVGVPTGNLANATLYLIRHGTTGQYFSTPETPLNDQGRDKTYALGCLLAAENVDLICSGPDERHKRSAQILSEITGATGEISVDALHTVIEREETSTCEGIRKTTDTPFTYQLQLPRTLEVLGDADFFRSPEELAEMDELSAKQAKQVCLGCIFETDLLNQRYSRRIAKLIRAQLLAVVFPDIVVHVTVFAGEPCGSFDGTFAEPLEYQEKSTMSNLHVACVGSARVLQIIRDLIEHGVRDENDLAANPTFGELRQYYPIPYSGCWKMQVNHELRLVGPVTPIAPKGVVFEPGVEPPSRYK